MPSAAINIPSSSVNSNVVSLSPTTGMSMSPNQGSFRDRLHRESFSQPNTIRQPKVLHPVDKDALRLLLLENISQDAVKAFTGHGFQVDHFTKAWTEDELVAKIGSYHAIGIRSKTKITDRVLKAASKVSTHRLRVHRASLI